MKSIPNSAFAGARTQALLRCAICLFLVLSRAVIVAEDRADVVVYGGTPAGIAAALAAALSDLTIELVEPSARIGGLVTSGLSHSDFRTFEALTGAFLGFAQRVETHYSQTYGPDSPQVRDSFRGTFGEPKVNLLVLEKMLAAHPSILLRNRFVLDAVTIAIPADNRRHIDSARFRAQDGSPLILRGRVFIDASYEGDLMARAGVAWRAGRERRDEFGESLAPEQADDQLQAYNFRFIMPRNWTNHSRRSSGGAGSRWRGRLGTRPRSPKRTGEPRVAISCAPLSIIDASEIRVNIQMELATRCVGSWAARSPLVAA
jgi:hypothetical protein